MATRFAVASTAWNTPSTWDNGAVPVAGDTVYPNGFTVPIDTDISVASLNNNVSPVGVPNIVTPVMTSNTTPVGIGTVIANALAVTPWAAFNQDGSGSGYASGVNNTGFLGYTFTSPKVIKRYSWKQPALGNSYAPKTWEFQGSNDGFATPGVKLDEALSYTTNANYYSGIINPSNLSFTSYRINITAGATPTVFVYIGELEMTESVGAIFGANNGGSFTVPSTLVGTREITFSGDGIRIASGTTCINIASLSGSTVNFKTINGGAIFKNNWAANGTNGKGVAINGNCAVVFNGDIVGTIANIYNDGASGNIYINASATVTINGNVIAPTISNTYPSYLIQSAVTTSNNAILNINGNIVSGVQITTYALQLNGINTVNLIGNITATQGYAINCGTILYLNITGTISYTNASSITPIFVTAASIINITGSVTAPPNAAAINCSTGAVTINVPTGIVTAGTNAVGIAAPSATLVTIGNSPIINSNNFMAIYAPRIRFYTGAQVEWTFQTSTGETKVLRNADGSSGLPSFTDVKIGQPFGPNNDIIGACVIPPANAVGVGIPVSTIVPINQPVPVTVGTSQLTGEDLLTAISTSSNVVAQRIKNLATVETTGDQLAAFNRI